jgi:hypothetical protein
VFVNFDLHSDLPQELNFVGLRFEQQLTANPSDEQCPCSGSRILSCMAIHNPHFTPNSGHDTVEEISIEGSGHSSDISRCLVLWEALEESNKAMFFLLFDINRWYHAQMPGCIRQVSQPIPSSHTHNPVFSDACLIALVYVHT